MAQMRPFACALIAAIVAAGCAGDDEKPDQGGGTVVIATVADADNLLPPLVRTAQGQQVVDQIFERLADLKPGGSTAGDSDFTPRLATSWEWAADSLSIAFHVNPAARWHDGMPVRASDVAFSFELYKDSLLCDAAATMSAVDSVSVADSLTAVLWFSRRDPEQFFNAIWPTRIMPQHLLVAIPRDRLALATFTRNPVGSGPFRFVRWEANEVLELAADTANYHGRPSLDRLLFVVAPDAAAATTRVMTGEADFFDGLQPEAVEEVSRSEHSRAIMYPSTEYTFLALNFRAWNNPLAPHQLLADRGIRRAITMATDRAGVTRSALGGHAKAVAGPFISSLETADSAQRQHPHDPMRAANLLDSLGWRIVPGSDVRTKNGRPLEFRILVPGSNRARQRAASHIRDDLQKIGINAIVEEVETADFAFRVRTRDFDSYLGAWAMTPSPSSIRGTWSARSDSGSGAFNYSLYESRMMSATVDSALAAFDPARRKLLFRRAYQISTDDFAAIWLYEAESIAAVHARIRIPSLAAFWWWSNIREWSVDPAARIPRDMMRQ